MIIIIAYEAIINYDQARINHHLKEIKSGIDSLIVSVNRRLFIKNKRRENDCSAVLLRKEQPIKLLHLQWYTS